MAWTTTELLADIRRRARLSTTDPDHTDANLLLDADGQMDELIVPLVVGANSDYYLTYADHAITAGQGTYAIPERAVASAPRQVFIVDSTGQALELPCLPLNDRYGFPPTGTPAAFAIEDDLVVLFPAPDSTQDTLRIYYERQPNKLIAAASCAVTEDYDSSTGTFTCVTVPTSITDDTLLDVVSGRSPFVVFAESLDPVTVVTGAAGTIDFAASEVVAADLRGRILADSFGHYLCPAGYTCLPQIPSDLHSVLALAVAVEILDQVGDPLAQGMRGKLELAVRRAGGKLQPRVKGAPHKIVSRNSYLRRGRGRWAASR